GPGDDSAAQALAGIGQGSRLYCARAERSAALVVAPGQRADDGEQSARLAAPAWEEGPVAPIEADVDIARPPEEVFAYVTDPSRWGEGEWGVEEGHSEGGGAAGWGIWVHHAPPLWLEAAADL